jgi:hypothetical protein
MSDKFDYQSKLRLYSLNTQQYSLLIYINGLIIAVDTVRG